MATVFEFPSSGNLQGNQRLTGLPRVLNRQPLSRPLRIPPVASSLKRRARAVRRIEATAPGGLVFA